MTLFLGWNNELNQLKQNLHNLWSGGVIAVGSWFENSFFRLPIIVPCFDVLWVDKAGARECIRSDNDVVNKFDSEHSRGNPCIPLLTPCCHVESWIVKSFLRHHWLPRMREVASWGVCSLSSMSSCFFVIDTNGESDRSLPKASFATSCLVPIRDLRDDEK